MKLSKYLETSKLTQEQFGRLIKVKKMAVCHYVNGTRKPRPLTARRIVKATKGEVTLEDLY